MTWIKPYVTPGRDSAALGIRGRTPYGNGRQAYAGMMVTAPGGPTPVQSFTGGLVP